MTTPLRRWNRRTEPPSESIDWIEVVDEQEDVPKALHHLRLLAAFIAPLQKRHSLHICRLTDYAPNKGFAERNYGNGEHVVLVLKDGKGQWLTFRAVLHVALHELVHCRISAHNTEFHTLLCLLTSEAAELIKAGWTGAGEFGLGMTLEGQMVEKDLGRWGEERVVDGQEQLLFHPPENTCTGTPSSLAPPALSSSSPSSSRGPSSLARPTSPPPAPRRRSSTASLTSKTAAHPPSKRKKAPFKSFLRAGKGQKLGGVEEKVRKRERGEGPSSPQELDEQRHRAAAAESRLMGQEEKKSAVIDLCSDEE